MSRVLWITLALNGVSAAVKLAQGLSSGSIALLAGGFDSVSDGGANVVALVAARQAAHPPDAGHPYGHRKFETLVAGAIGGGLLVTAGRVAWGAIDRLANGAPPIAVTPATLAAPIIAMLIGIGTATYESRRARELGSEMLAADARHTLADAGVTMALLAGLVAVRAGYPIVDPLVALGIAAVVAQVGASILRQSSQVLADSAVLDPTAVAQAARQVPGVVDAHKVRSRGASTDVAVDLHVQVDPDLGIERAHAIAHEVSDLLRREFTGVVDVVVHVEPMWSEVEDGVLRAVRRALADCHVQAHDVSVHFGDLTEACLHLELDPRLTLDEAHAIATAVEETVRRRVPSLHRVVTHLEPRPPHPPVASGPGAGDRYAVFLAQAAGEVAGLGEPHAVETVRLPSGVCLSAHIEAPGVLTLAAAHALAQELEDRLRALAPDLDRVFLHVEPPADKP